jgi:outer membrane murein-binding lipoprotein Lpp
MRKIKIFFLLVAVLTATALTGCSKSYPLGMSEAEWGSLSSDQQTELMATQAQIDRYRADQTRCRQVAEMKMQTQVPVQGFSSAERVNVSMGVDKALYEECLRQAGWSEERLQPILYWMNTAENDSP